MWNVVVDSPRGAPLRRWHLSDRVWLYPDPRLPQVWQQYQCDSMSPPTAAPVEAGMHDGDHFTDNFNHTSSECVALYDGWHNAVSEGQ